ncbi:MAG TPA: hypothetical protein VFR49_10990, partial [Solirubrobacteraceae bacterium]|nr:hypothetical protein [Solirubrobacteraceae bacterium]
LLEGGVEVVEPAVVEPLPAEPVRPAVEPLAVPDQAIDEEGNLVVRTDAAATATGTELLRVDRRGLARFRAKERELGEDRDPAVTWLPRAIRRLAATDPRLAARIIVQLLPAQALSVPGRLAYDLTIPELGSFRVSLVGGRGIAVPLAAPGAKVSSEVDFHMRASADALAEIALGASPKRMLLAGRIRIRGRRRRARALRGFADRPPSLTEIARAGVRLDPWLLYTALAEAIEPEWTAGHHFVLRHDITGTGGSTVHLIVRDGERIMVTRDEPGEPPVATVKTSVRAFHAGLAGQAPPPGEPVGVGGDLVAVGALKRWTEWAQSGGPDSPASTPA